MTGDDATPEFDADATEGGDAADRPGATAPADGTEAAARDAAGRAPDGGGRGGGTDSEAPGAPRDSGPSWRAFFPYDSPYDDQADGAETVAEVARDGGFAVVEGACGTGKTLMALCGALECVRDPDTQYRRVLALTSVKQQLRAFEDDLEAINANLPDGVRPVTALTMVGKTDLCSYVDAGLLDGKEIHSTCDALRDEVRARIARAGEGEAGAAAGEVAGQWARESGVLSGDGWQTGAYGATRPEAGDDATPPGCPFYAAFRRERAHTAEETPVMGLDGLTRPGDLLERASAEGLCPHSVLTDVFDTAEVLVGNYRHIFDDRTVGAMTHAVIDPETLVVCDEAHNMERLVRELQSEAVSGYALSRAASLVRSLVLGDGAHDAAATGAVRAEAATLIEDGTAGLEERARELVALFDAAEAALADEARAALEEDLDGDWRRRTRRPTDGIPEEVTRPLRDPEAAGQTDALTETLGDHPALDHARATALAIGEGMEEARQRHDTVPDAADYVVGAGRTLGEWAARDHTAHFREVALERREERFNTHDRPWGGAYRGELRIRNCVPADPIRRRLAQFGGGVLMSATIEPLDTFAEVTGLADLDRPVVERTYGLSFPEENRESYIVPAPAFTYANRGPPDAGSPYREDDHDRTRDAHAEAVAGVARETPGNVLVCMPSYAEAEWVAGRLRARPDVDKEVLVDESSSAGATDALKREFFAGGGKVLATSMRGTLTEGVDYDGDRLDACVVCGVPVRNMGSDHASAILAAYEAYYGDDGFDYAFGYPAVRKARQAIGRVIRGTDDRGVRVLVDERYAAAGESGGWESFARTALPDGAAREFVHQPPDLVGLAVDSFWT